MAKKVEQERLPPYVSYATWMRLINGLVDFVPDVIDSSVYSRLRFSGSDIKKLRTALRRLNLIDESAVPRQELRSLVEAQKEGAEPDAKSVVLRQIIDRAYPFMADEDFNLSSATRKQLEDRLAAMGATGNMQKPCTTFFLNLAVEAGLDISPHLSSRDKSGVGRLSTVRKAQLRRRQETARNVPREEPGSPPLALSSRDNLIIALDIDPTLAALLHLLPAKGRSWGSGDKRRFLAAFKAVLDAVYPDQLDDEGGVSPA